MKRLAIVSTGVRRDLIAPLGFFTAFQPVHFYRKNNYDDLEPEEQPESLYQYTSASDLYRRLLAASPDLIQTVEPLSFYQQPALWACIAAARRTGARVVVPSLENRPLDEKFNPPGALVLRHLAGAALRRACLIIAVNEGARRNLITCGAAPERLRKMLWGTWGVDITEFSPGSEPQEGPPSILFAGRLVPEKGLLPLLDAFELVKHQIPAARLRVAGDGILAPILRERVGGEKWTESAELYGIVKNRRMPAMMRASHIVAVPSLTTRRWAEQVGMVALQAMACGVPVVAFDSGALPEFVPDGVAGLVVREGDVAALAAALISLLSDGTLQRRLGAGARAHAVEHYDAQKNIRDAERLIVDQCFESRI
jgi:glycosyltransferase involved in cell wall biosynthesis